MNLNHSIFVEIFLCLLFIFFHFFCKKNSGRLLLFAVLLYSFCFVFFLFGLEFLYFGDKTALLICLFTITFNAFYFFSYRPCVNYNLVSIAIHSLCFSLIACYAKVVPLNPLILLYYKVNTLFYSTPYPIINLFILYLSVSVLPLLKARLYIFYFSLFFLMFFMQKFTSSNQYTHHKKLKIGVVQVGLYYQLGGSTADFFPELLKFLKNNNDVDIVAFSENTVYGFKDEFNKRITLEMISDLNKSKAQQHHAFIFNFFGFNNINNAVSVYVYKDKNIINQKTTLIPFVEQKWAFSIKNDDLHEYLSIHKNIINKNINHNKLNIKTYICYDALFPEPKKLNSDVVIVQSNYKQLDKNKMYNKIIKNGSVLGWFSVAINSATYINIQNHGGTVLIRKNGKIDDEVFSTSLMQPFFVVDI